MTAASQPALGSRLFHAMFDDAAIFPPGNAAMADAVPAHTAHRRAWYAPLVGPFVCAATRLDELAGQLGERSQPFAVSITVPGGAAESAQRARAVAGAPGLQLAGLEVRLGAQPLHEAVAMLPAAGVPTFVEIPAERVDAAAVRALREAGLLLKLRTGGTSAEAFPSESQLASAIAHAVAGQVRFKCTAGLHHAVRHRDRETGFGHHGFGNVILAVHAALTGADPRERLGAQDAAAIAADISALDDAQVAGVREMFAYFGTCSVTDPVGDLTAMGLLSAP